MIDEKTYKEYLNYLIQGDKAACSRIVKQFLEQGINIKELYMGLFQHALYEVGDMWEKNKISVATEHLATSITESLLNLTYPIIFEAEHIGKKAVIACVANEFHQVGGKMVADIFELNGWDGYFVGANTPRTELFKLIEAKKPDLLALSLSIYFNLPNLLRLLDDTRKHFPDLPIIVGGQAFRWGGKENLQQFDKLKFIADLHELEEYINTYSN